MANGAGWLSRAKSKGKELISKAIGGDQLGPGSLSTAEAEFGYDQVSVSMLLGSGRRSARARIEIYTKYHYMMGDPIISTALRAHVTMALGGDEESGDTVFIDTLADAEKDANKKAIIDEIKADLEPIFNRIAHQIAFNACGFGDSYARVYTRDGEGINDVYCDEAIFPPLVQPYCRGTQTIGYVVSAGKKFTERLTIKQMVRAKMPRMLYVAQTRVIDKAMRTTIAEDDVDNLPVLPDLVGGSFLEGVEEAYDNLAATLVGLVGQRILNSIDESMIGVNLEGMTLQQRKEFMKSIKDMLVASKAYAAEAVKRGTPVTERRFHLIPTFNEKQLTQVQGFQGTSGAQAMSVEDVMFHAKLLAGALGIDLSMLGFSAMLSGGLGEGGFFRTSVQAAERSRIIRTCLETFFNDVVDIHTLSKYGWVFDKKDRPFRVTFYGANAALEAEKQSSRERAMNTASLMLTNLGILKDLGLDETASQQIIEKIMNIDEELSKMLAKGLVAAAKAAKDAEAQANGGGPFGGGPGPADDDDAGGGDVLPFGVRPPANRKGG